MESTHISIDLVICDHYSHHHHPSPEEFDWRASQLSRDLRDGVRLARLIDALEVRRDA
jgi:hypothetical protein